MRRLRLQLHPVTLRRLARFRAMRRAWWSFWILVVAYVLSLGAELISNDKPLWLRFEGRSFVPVFRFYSERDILGAGNDTVADFKAIVASERFVTNARNRVVWPIIPHGPREILRAERIQLPDVVTVRWAPEPHMAVLQVTPDLLIARAQSAAYFLGVDDGAAQGLDLAGAMAVPGTAREAIGTRFRNEAAPEFVATLETGDGSRIELSMPPYVPRGSPPRAVRLTLREVSDRVAGARVVVNRDRSFARPPPAAWNTLDAAARSNVLALAVARFAAPVEPLFLQSGEARLRATAQRDEVRFPLRPVPGHPLGIDSAGRDVLARLIYGFRTSMSFGLLLVVATLLVGTLIGAAQGYHGGKVDLIGQRVIEVWDALPFLYILILMGSIYGRSFLLLLAVYAMFNWIGISYYMRAEFLRLRHQPFVDAARGLGLPSSAIMFRHILPNALVPIITFFPFSLVSAIGTLSALDFLGFGLPPPTPSWGELLAQAQEYNWAWWLALYPSLALFVVMLLGVFVGEGVRAAYDPRPHVRWKG